MVMLPLCVCFLVVYSRSLRLASARASCSWPSVGLSRCALQLVGFCMEISVVHGNTKTVRTAGGAGPRSERGTGRSAPSPPPAHSRNRRHPGVSNHARLRFTYSFDARMTEYITADGIVIAPSQPDVFQCKPAFGRAPLLSVPSEPTVRAFDHEPMTSCEGPGQQCNKSRIREKEVTGACTINRPLITMHD